MAVELATAYVALTVETRNVAKEVQQGFAPVAGQADKAGRTAGKGFVGGMKNSGLMKCVAGLFGGAMAGLAVKNFLGDALTEARESQKVGALTQSIIKSTGGTAKVTAGQVGELAEAISRKTGVDDEAIQTGANLLLTFKNVRNEAGAGNDMFNKATAAALDLSKAGFGSVDGAAKMLGKALNDPIKGISALGRAGVTFTAAQKEQIKVLTESGDVLGAQKIIMAEVESQVGGAAEATATAGDKARVVFDNLKESAGAKLLPMIDKLAIGFTTLVTEFQKGEGTGGKIRDIFSKVGDVVNEVKDGITAFGAAWRYNDGEVTSSGFPGVMERLGFYARQTFDYFTGTVWPFMVKYQNVLIPVAAGILAIVAAVKIWSTVTKIYTGFQIALNVAMSLNPIGIVILAIVGLVAALVVAYKRSETFRDIVNGVWAAIKKAIAGTVDWFKNTAWPWLRDALESIKNAFTTAKDKVTGAWDTMKSKLNAGYTWVRDNVFTPFKTAVAAVQKKFEDVRDGIGRAWDGLKEKTKAPIRFVINTVLNDGLIAGFNWLSGKIGGPSIGRIPLPRGFAGGGVMPGYTPGRDVHKFYSPTAGRLDLSGGEAIMRPEFTRLVGGLPGVNKLNDMAKRGSLGVQGFASGGVFGWIKGKAKGAFDWMLDKASSIYQAATNPTKFIKDKLAGLTDRIPGGSAMRDTGKAVVQKGIGAVVTKLQGLWSAFKGAFSKAEDTGGGTAGGAGMGWRAQVAWAKKHTPWAAITSTVRSGNPASDHDKGRAIDLAGSGVGMSKTFEAIRDYFNVKAIRSLYYSPKGSRQIRFNAYGNTPPHIFNTHKNHVHWAMANGGVFPKPQVFDRGGVIKPGLNVLDNRTGGNEQLARVGAGGGYQVRDINVTVALEQLADVRTLQDFLEMLERPVQIKAASGRVDG